VIGLCSLSVNAVSRDVCQFRSVINNRNGYRWSEIGGQGF